ncbi:hypothetical protein LPTSP3_g08460 [Leptospira kobayashii]|uniref:Lipoprotein n=1 Tax=Leptospira kobayashii TaxID=1917830 RepID=A0ABN6KE19_9LEPT|nr:hypothetical protein [Leptospira kobayashii]BDA77916.1 hypothetical protein LPTSP3_g08460 [Leptospira kobayashii]
MKKIITAFTIFVITSLTLSIFPSGGFGGGGVAQVPQGKDREKFHLGKAVFNQEVELATATDKTKEVAQAERLDYLQGALPNTEKRRVSLPDFAGKLTEEQLDALEYFVSIRFNVKLDKK